MTLSLTRGDVETVVKELLEVQDLSRVIGLQLKVPRRIVADIHKRYTNPKDRLYYVLVEFLKQVEPRPTWSAIVDALRSPAVNLQYLAQRIQRKYCLGDDESRSFHSELIKALWWFRVTCTCAILCLYQCPLSCSDQAPSVHTHEGSQADVYPS